MFLRVVTAAFYTNIVKRLAMFIAMREFLVMLLLIVQIFEIASEANLVKKDVLRLVEISVTSNSKALLQDFR